MGRCYLHLFLSFSPRSLHQSNIACIVDENVWRPNHRKKKCEKKTYCNFVSKTKKTQNLKMFFSSPNVIRKPFFSLDCLLENNYSKAWTDGRHYHPEFDHPESDRPLIPNLSNHCYQSRSDHPYHPKTDGLCYHPKLPLY